MKLMFILLTIAFTTHALAIGCNCEVRVYAPLTGSHKLPPASLKTFQLEEYGTYSINNQKECRKSCEEEFYKSLPTASLKSLLLLYSERLISEGVLGYNCTGLTTFKYPVRVKASLGPMGLGNVANHIYVVNHEEICF